MRLGRGMQEQDNDILNHVFNEQGAVLDKDLAGISLGYLKILPQTFQFGLDQTPSTRGNHRRKVDLYCFNPLIVSLTYLQAPNRWY